MKAVLPFLDRYGAGMHFLQLLNCQNFYVSLSMRLGGMDVFCSLTDKRWIDIVLFGPLSLVQFTPKLYCSRIAQLKIHIAHHFLFVMFRVQLYHMLTRNFYIQLKTYFYSFDDMKYNIIPISMITCLLFTTPWSLQMLPRVLFYHQQCQQ